MNLTSWFNLLVCGVIIGIANIIPGVSGGTMAVILNIYDKLIASVSEFRKDPVKSVKYLTPIGMGGIIGILGFSFIIKFLLTEFKIEVNFVFIGLIIGSIPLIYKRMGSLKKNSIAKITVFIAGVAILIGLSLFNEDRSSSILPNTLFTYIKLMIDSMIGAGAMILPGISGSLVLVILGSYFTILTAISTFNIILLIPVAIGLLLGLVIGSKLIALFLKKHEEVTFSAIMGLIIGSLLVLVSKNIPEIGFRGLISLFLMLVGIYVTLWFSKRA